MCGIQRHQTHWTGTPPFRWPGGSVTNQSKALHVDRVDRLLVHLIYKLEVYLVPHGMILRKDICSG